MTAVMLAGLVSLGTWQLQRHGWKSSLLADIDRGEASPAIALPPDPVPFTKVYVEGVLRDDLNALYGSELRTLPTGPVLGAHLLTPLQRPGAAPIIVDRGWVPTDRLRPVEPTAPLVTGRTPGQLPGGSSTYRTEAGDPRPEVLAGAAVALLGLYLLYRRRR